MGALLGAALLSVGSAGAASEPLHLAGDAAFIEAAQERGWPGDGSAGRPYIIDGLDITAIARPGIHIKDTTVHFVLRSCAVRAGDAQDGIRLTNVANARVEACVVENARHGVHLDRTSASVVANTTIKSSTVGVLLEGATGNVVRDNKIAINARDVHLRNARHNVFRNNNLSIAAGQVGFHFHDEDAYDNDIDPTNVVNYVPVRWYANVAGAPSSPLVLNGLSVELRGITNVAQVMLYNSSHVELRGVTATAGLGAGVAVHDSRQITVADARVEGNRGPGVRVTGGGDVRAEDVTARANGVGVQVTHSPRATLHAVNATENGGAGVLVTGDSQGAVVEESVARGNRVGVELRGVRDATVRASTIAENRGRGVVADGASGPAVTGNAILANGADGVTLRRVTGAVVDGNAIRQHERNVLLVGSAGNALRDNTISTSAGEVGLFFASEASYDNAVAPTNTVNGVPLRWYASVSGTPANPLTLSGLHVDVTGATNVAQVMVYNGSHVRLEGVTASHGTADGIVVLASDNVTIASSTVEENRRTGVRVERGGDHRVLNSTVDGNGRAGVLLDRAPRAYVADSRVEDNGASGVQVTRRAHHAEVHRSLVRGNGGRGVDVAGSDAPTIQASNVSGNRGAGVHLAGAAQAEVRDNTLHGNGNDGLVIRDSSPGVIVEGNAVSGHRRGVVLADVQGALFRENRVTIAPGEVGFFFQGPASYDNGIGVTNTVNGAPVRWYRHVAGTPEAPVVLSGFEATVPGVTNVAQVMLYNASHARLEGVVVRGGVADGVVITGSDNVTVAASEVAGNARNGVRVDGGADSGVHDATVRENGHSGILLDGALRGFVTESRVAANSRSGVLATPGSLGVHVRGSELLENGMDGLRATQADGVTITGVNASGNGGAGLRVAATAGAVIEANRAFDNGGAGVSATRVTDVLVRSNHLGGNGGDGIHLRAAGATVVENRVAGHDRGIRLSATRDATLRANAVTIATGQTGIHFDDARSYDNQVNVSNTVNGVPVRWYTHRSGAPGAPLTLTGLRAELAGITNVAQVMLYNVTHARLEGVVANNGTGDGVRVLRSHNVTLASPEVVGNAGHGVSVAEPPHSGPVGVRLEDATVEANGGSGVVLDGVVGCTVTGGRVAANGVDGVTVGPGAHGTVVDGVTLAANGGAGVEARRASQVAVRGSVVQGNGGDGVSARAAPGAVIEGNVVRENGGDGVALRDVRAATVAGNEVRGHGRNVRLSASPGGSFQSNHITIAPGEVGFHFDDERSYDNQINDSNAVNGVPVRWFTYVTGREDEPVALSGFNVTLPGITNVAQVMVYESSYVRLDGVRAENGVGDGVRLHRSSSITVANVSATGAGNAGIRLHETLSSTVEDVDASRSRIGVELVKSSSNTVARTRALGAETAVLLRQPGSLNNRVFQTNATGATVAVRDASFREGDPNRGDNLIADGGLDKRGLMGAPIAFADATGVARFHEERVVAQWWDFGDGDRATQGGGGAFRPSHVYAEHGTYWASYAIETADGQRYADAVRVAVLHPLTAPRGLQAVLGNGTINLAWRPPLHTGGEPVTAYKIFRGADGSEPALVATVGNITAYQDESVVNGVTYAYAVAAVNARGEGPRSAAATATPAEPPTPPLGLTARVGAAGGGVDNVTLAWLAPESNGGANLTGYVVYRGPSADALAPLEAIGNRTAYSDSAVEANHTYAYAVAAVNPRGEGPRSVPVLVEARARTVAAAGFGPPAPPDGARVGDPRPAISISVRGDVEVRRDLVRLTLDGRDVTAEAAVSDTSILFLPTSDLEPGRHSVRLAVTLDAGERLVRRWNFTVVEAGGDGASFEYAGLRLSAPRAAAGETVTVTSRVRNAGDASGVAEARLLVDGRLEGAQRIALAPGAGKMVSFNLTLGSPGAFAVTIGDQPVKTLVVEAAGAPGATGPAENGTGGNGTSGSLDRGVPGPGAGVVLSAMAMACALALRGARRRVDGWP